MFAKSKRLVFTCTKTALLQLYLSHFVSQPDLEAKKNIKWLISSMIINDHHSINSSIIINQSMIITDLRISVPSSERIGTQRLDIRTRKLYSINSINDWIWWIKWLIDDDEPGRNSLQNTCRISPPLRGAYNREIRYLQICNLHISISHFWSWTTREI